MEVPESGNGEINRQNSIAVNHQRQVETEQSNRSQPEGREKGNASGEQGASSSSESKFSETQLTSEEQAKVQELKQVDRKVRQHEAAHLAASGGIAVSGASFTYKRGPDGVNYAVGGEVKIDTSSGNTPEKTIAKANKIAAAAMAPADPSPQDRSVSAKARSMESNARAEMAREKSEEMEEAQKTGSTETDNTKVGETDTEKTVRTTGDTQNKVTATKGFERKEDDEPHAGIKAYERTEQSVEGGRNKPENILDLVA